MGKGKKKSGKKAVVASSEETRSEFSITDAEATKFIEAAQARQSLKQRLHELSTEEETFVCISTTIGCALKSEAEFAEEANRVNSQCIGSFFTRNDAGLVLRTASACSLVETERSAQVQMMIEMHNGNISKFLPNFRR